MNKITINKMPTSTHTSQRRRYPWKDWLLGGKRELRQGIDFACEYSSFLQNFHRVIKLHGLTAITRKYRDDDGVRVIEIDIAPEPGPQKVSFFRHLRAMHQFQLREGHCRIPAVHVEQYGDKELRLGAWAANLRNRYRNDGLRPEQIQNLELFPGWDWSLQARGRRRWTGARHKTRDQRILDARKTGRSIRQIGEDFGLTSQRIYQIVAQGRLVSSTVPS